MIVAVARARKDAKALRHALDCEIMSLGGIRSFKDFDLSQLKDKIPIFFFGRDEIELADEIEEEISKMTPIYQIVILSKKAVRNTRIEEIRSMFELAKARIRLGFKFDDVFIFSNRDHIGIDVDPDYDAYFIIGRNFVENTRRIFGIDVEEGNLVIRKMYNEEWIYCPELKAIISKKIGEEPSVKFHKSFKPKRIDIDEMIARNRKWLKKLEEISISFIRENAKGSAGVPFSGGKDSTAALIIAKKALGNVKALYVRVKDYEMPHTEDYVEYVCDKLNVELIKETVEFDVRKYGFPTHDNRWCTRIKMEGLKKIATDTLIVGDREAESRIRRYRPEILRRIRTELFPIKYWSAGMVQLYVLMNGLKLHPLYYKGFYRLGCTICPSLSGWEISLLKFLNA